MLYIFMTVAMIMLYGALSISVRFGASINKLHVEIKKYTEVC